MDTCILKPYCFILKLHESIHKYFPAVLIKTAADMVKGLVIKVFDESVEVIFHLQVHNDVGVLFEIDRLHLKDFFPQPLQLPQ